MFHGNNISSDHINDLENFIYRNKTKSFSVYLVVIIAITIFIFSLPLIKIDVSSQSRGIVMLKIILVNLGNTLIKINSEVVAI